MRNEIASITGDVHGKIAGHSVITVWCASSEMISWANILEKDALIEEKEALIEEKDAVIEEQEALTEDLIEENAMKDQEIENLRRRLQEFESSNQVVETNELRTKRSRPKQEIKHSLFN